MMQSTVNIIVTIGDTGDVVEKLEFAEVHKKEAKDYAGDKE